MQLGICSFSFHRLLATGKQDIFSYIVLCRRLGCTQLDPWNAHLAPPADGATVLHAGRNPGQSHQLLSAPDEWFIGRVADAAAAAGLPFGTIAVDGAHIYEPTDAARRDNRARAYAWLSVAQRLRARQVRIDAGGPEEMPDEIFSFIVDGYRDLIDRAGAMGIEILIENHWGPSIIPANMIRLIEAAPGLGLLYDTRNWKPGLKDQGRRLCARYARATHVKTRRWDAQGNEPDEDIRGAVQCLMDADYRGVWGIESVPDDADELAGATHSIALLRRLTS